MFLLAIIHWLTHYCSKEGFLILMNIKQNTILTN